jgi:site-specific recombinase XerC
LDRLQPEHIEALYARMQQSGLTPGTVHSLHRILRTALNEAVRRDKLSRNPLSRARPPRLTEREMEPLSREEAARLIHVAGSSRTAPDGRSRWHSAFVRVRPWG